MLPNTAETGNLREGWQGANIFFEKRIGKSSLLSLTVPARFVRQHGDKIQKHVILESEADGHLWTVEMTVSYPHGYTQVYLYGGWKEFAAFHGLVRGDYLTFTLVAKSKLKVRIVRSNEDVDTKPRPHLQSNEPPSMYNYSQTGPRTRLQRPHSFVDLTESEKPALRCHECNALIAKTTESAALEADAADSSSGESSDVDSYFFEPVHAAAPPPFSPVF